MRIIHSPLFHSTRSDMVHFQQVLVPVPPPWKMGNVNKGMFLFWPSLCLSSVCLTLLHSPLSVLSCLHLFLRPVYEPTDSLALAFASTQVVGLAPLLPQKALLQVSSAQGCLPACLVSGMAACCRRALSAAPGWPGPVIFVHCILSALSAFSTIEAL